MAQWRIKCDDQTTLKVSFLIRFAAIPSKSLATVASKIPIFRDVRQTSRCVGNCANKLHIAKQWSVLDGVSEEQLWLQADIPGFGIDRLGFCQPAHLYMLYSVCTLHSSED